VAVSPEGTFSSFFIYLFFSLFDIFSARSRLGESLWMSLYPIFEVEKIYHFPGVVLPREIFVCPYHFFYDLPFRRN
jgi:hypothetical protein